MPLYKGTLALFNKMNVKGVPLCLNVCTAITDIISALLVLYVLFGRIWMYLTILAFVAF